MTTLTGPYTHENLTVFLIHDTDTIPADAYLTLEEAFDQKKVTVHETGNVGELLIENLLDDKDVFIQAGEILRGGRQDRAIGVDFIVPAKSKLPFPTFCVEMGRWHRRGAESAAAFSSSKHYLSSKDLKLAAKMKASQHAVWDGVADAQAKLSESVGHNMRSEVSPSSLELSLEHEKLQERRQAYRKALEKIIEDKPDAVGFAFAINGELNTAETYASAILFRKLWKKLLESAAIEAVAESGGKAKPNPTVTSETVRQFLVTSDAGRDDPRPITDRVTLHTKRTPKTVLFETEDKGRQSARIHKNYIWETD